MFQRLIEIVRWQRRDKFESMEPASKRIAMWMAPHLTANQITLVGGLLCIPSGIFYALDMVFAGSVMMTLSLLTDWFDGAVGRHQEGWRNANGLEPMTLEQEQALGWIERVNFRGVTHFGRVADPLLDKLRTATFLFTAGLSVVNSWLIWSITVVAVALTAMRPIKQKLNLDHVGSNRFGKHKLHFEVLGMCAVVFLSPWSDYIWYNISVQAMFSIALVLALASLAGHVLSGYLTYRRRAKVLGRVHRVSVPVRDTHSR